MNLSDVYAWAIRIGPFQTSAVKCVSSCVWLNDFGCFEVRSKDECFASGGCSAKRIICVVLHASYVVFSSAAVALGVSKDLRASRESISQLFEG